MKTYEEIMIDVLDRLLKNVSPEPVDIRKEVAKAYAKQWIDEAANVAMDNVAEGLPVGDAIYELKNQIDAQ